MLFNLTAQTVKFFSTAGNSLLIHKKLKIPLLSQINIVLTVHFKLLITNLEIKISTNEQILHREKKVVPYHRSKII